MAAPSPDLLRFDDRPGPLLVRADRREGRLYIHLSQVDHPPLIIDR
jgi:hypothetical protein